MSQAEKGQRALKEPKLGVCATALRVTEDELRELWLLSQGQVPVGDRAVFCTDPSDPTAGR